MRQLLTDDTTYETKQNLLHECLVWIFCTR